MTHSAQGALALSQSSPFIFNFGDHAVRIVVIDGEPWFIASDVARALEYRDAEVAARHLKPHQKGVHQFGVPPQKHTIINESGLYRLVLRSRKPEAEAFSDWVTGEVLPSIRKTGSYQQPGREMTLEEIIAKMVQKVEALNDHSASLFMPLVEAVQRKMGKSGPKLLPERFPVRTMGDLSFFRKSGRKGSPYHGPDSFSSWWDYPQHLKELPWDEGLKVGRGFFSEVAELAEHDEHAAYIALESVLGIAWELPAGNPRRNSCIEYGFAQAMALAMMTGLRAMRGGATAYAWGV